MRVGVVGGGITGLALAHFLAVADIDVVAFEANTEPGGVMQSERHDDRVLEYGPQRLRLSEEIDELVADLDLYEDLIVVEDDPPLYVYADGRLRRVPKSIREFLGTDLLTWREKYRFVKEPFAKSLEETETVEEAFTRKFGEAGYRNLAEPLIGGMYGSDPAQMPIKYALENFVAFEDEHGSLLRGALKRTRKSRSLPPVASFEAGVQTLPRGLYRQHQSIVNLDHPVESIRPFAGGQFAIRTAQGSVGVDRIILTTPAPTAASLLDPIDDCTVGPLNRLRYNGLVIVHLEADLDRSGYGYQIRRGEDLSTLGVTWNQSLFGRDTVHTAFLGGMWEPELLDRPESELGTLAAEEFEEVTGTPADVIGVRKLPDVIPAYDRSWEALDRVELADGVILATNYTGRIGVPGRVREAKRIAEQLAAEAESLA